MESGYYALARDRMARALVDTIDQDERVCHEAETWLKNDRFAELIIAVLGMESGVSWWLGLSIPERSKRIRRLDLYSNRERIGKDGKNNPGKKRRIAGTEKRNGKGNEKTPVGNPTGNRHTGIERVHEALDGNRADHKME